ncbi:DUF302 domain-containing protein [Thiomicrospira sp.]|uniref:DUF302 domain-containing protein n=1 Tax=Thiomicrospira sp. TaxID=935 RepID=UPI0025E87E70|nr:DUF302 domain-containing protein [Thiomicrospira sp.]
MKQNILTTTLVPVLMFFMFSQASYAQNKQGLISVKSQHSVSQTMDKFEQIVLSKDLKVFAKIDHAAGAQNIGQTLRPTQLIIFGNAQGGTPLMQCQQTFGIDLPLKALVWQDERDQVWLSYNDLDYLTARHNSALNCGSAAKIKTLLQSMSRQATQ